MTWWQKTRYTSVFKIHQRIRSPSDEYILAEDRILTTPTSERTVESPAAIRTCVTVEYATPSTTGRGSCGRLKPVRRCGSRQALPLFGSEGRRGKGSGSSARITRPTGERIAGGILEDDVSGFCTRHSAENYIQFSPAPLSARNGISSWFGGCVSRKPALRITLHRHGRESKPTKYAVPPMYGEPAMPIDALRDRWKGGPLASPNERMRTPTVDFNVCCAAEIAIPAPID